MRIDCKIQLRMNEKPVDTILQSVENFTVGELLKLVPPGTGMDFRRITPKPASEPQRPEGREGRADTTPRPERKSRKLNMELKLSTSRINSLRAPRLIPQQLRVLAKAYGISYSAAKRLRHANALDIKWVK